MSSKLGGAGSSCLRLLCNDAPIACDETLRSFTFPLFISAINALCAGSMDFEDDDEDDVDWLASQSNFILLITAAMGTPILTIFAYFSGNGP